MTSDRILREYMRDVQMQQRLALRAKSFKDVEDMQKIVDELYWSIQLIKYWNSGDTSCKRHRKTYKRSKAMKLNDKNVDNIREDSRTLREIAKDYNVSVATIHNVKKYKSWFSKV